MRAWCPITQGNRIWSLRLLKAGSTSWGSGAINSDRGCRNAEEPVSMRSFARRKGSSAVNHLPDFSYAIALADHLERLDHALDDPPPDGGLWTGRAMDLLGRLVSPRRGLEYLWRLGFTRQVPRPRHARGDFAAQERFKADFRARMEELAREDPDRSVQVFDEHRAGLKPVIRRVWARRGQRPLALGHHRFQWLYVFGFVRPATGEVVWFLADAVNTAMFSEILAAFAREVGAGPDNLVVLVLDGAGWHVATDLVVPEGIHLEFLPPYSPELQPAEHLWPLINEPLANRHFTTLADLDQALGERCCDLADDDDRIRSSTQFHWWPAFI